MNANSKREEDHRKRVYEFYKENINLYKSYTAKHYLSLSYQKVPFITLFDALKTILVIKERLEVV